MTVLVWQDQDGDPVAVDSERIIGLSVGSLNGPHRTGADVTVTLIWTDAAQPFMVAASFADVLHRWIESRGESLAMKAHPRAYPLVAHQYPDGVKS